MAEIPRAFKHLGFTIDPSAAIVYFAVMADDGTVWFRTRPADAFGALMVRWNQLPPLPPRVEPEPPEPAEPEKSLEDMVRWANGALEPSVSTTAVQHLRRLWKEFRSSHGETTDEIAAELDRAFQAILGE